MSPMALVKEEEEEEEEEVTIKEKETVEKCSGGGGGYSGGASSPVVQSVNHLQSLHGALSDFVRHYNTLQHTLDSIQFSIDIRSKNLDDSLPNPLPPPKKEDKLLPEDSSSELESICNTMEAKALRKYISTHLSDIHRLRKEVPESLKRAPNPAKLVLDAMRRFYLQGRKAYARPDSYAIPIRRACILLLEFYVIAGCPWNPESDLSSSVKEDAEEASFAWRSRLIAEGGIESAGAEDALGLALFLASFGIPSQFSCRDLYHLLRLSNLRKKANIFRRSPILVEKMPDIIKDMIMKELQVEAVDLICAFGLREEYPPLPLLSSFVQKTYEVGVKDRREGQCSLISLKDANEKQLAALKSVVKCLEDHKLDAPELAGFNIIQKIAKLEKERSKGEQKLQDKNFKRKVEDVEPLKNSKTQAKRHCSASAEASHGLIDRSDMGLPAGSAPGPAGGWHWSGVVYHNSVGQSFLGKPYSSGNGFTGHSAAAEHNFYQPPASSHGTGGRNLYQFADTVLEHEAYRKSTTSTTVPTATTSGHHSFYMG